ncbi:MAG: c-type cytochrome [Anaerolineales bacterium]|jgi:mono/diheme cytochrome c family protein
MDEREKQEYLEQYQKKKEKGVPFFPDILFKDAVVSLIVFLALVALAYFIGAPLEERADPADTTYTPRPEWYFLFLFQLLKYFPGSLEFVGVVLIPTVAILLLFLLPLLDRDTKRHFLNRPVVTGGTILGIIGVVALTVLSIREAPPPSQEAAGGDRTAQLYTENCSPCHGPTIAVPAGTDLHEIIAQGKHEGMPAWSADLTSNEIDALAGFILSPQGSQLFASNCGECHEVSVLVASDPLELKNALQEGSAYEPHSDVVVPEWGETLSNEERTSLLNFLVAPDGQRLFQVNCSTCHGRSVAFAGTQEELGSVISQGGLHLEMPPWSEKLQSSELDILAQYVVEPADVPEGQALFEENCASCHGERIPAAESVADARLIIASGGSHETMPIWGQILTQEQLDALVDYTYRATQGTSVEVGQELFIQNCSPCHGDFGEGGPNPARAGDVIPPISMAEYLKTRDDTTLRAIIAQGQPNFGMSPFGSAFGGPLDDDQIDAIVAFIRQWEADPPVELPPEVEFTAVPLSADEIYESVCSQCHGPEGGGGVGPSLSDPEFHAERSDQEIYDIINLGHEATTMIAWGEVFTAQQVEDLVEFIRTLEQPEAGEPETEAEETPTPSEGPVSFANDVLPLFEEKCTSCHGVLGGWDGTTYEAVMNTGDHAPVVIPGDVENSLLAQKVLGTHEQGAIMPPGGKMPEDEINIILDWIAAGAPDN